MPNTQIVQEWITALRSGKYKQGTTMLRKDDTYCCLGVLCDLIKGKLGYDWYTFGSPSWYFKGGVTDEMTSGGLPHKALDLVGIIDCMGVFEITEDLRSKFPKLRQISRDHTALSELNDTHNWTYEEIANLIEANPPGLFRESTPPSA